MVALLGIVNLHGDVECKVTLHDERSERFEGFGEMGTLHIKTITHSDRAINRLDSSSLERRTTVANA